MMTTGLQIALGSGLIVGCGLAMLMWYLVPHQASLRDVVTRYSLDQIRARSRDAELRPETREDRIGLWAAKRFPAALWTGIPAKDLALLQIPTYRHIGDKVIGALVGFLAVPLLTYVAAVLGVRLPLVIPLLGSFALAVVLFLAPDRDVARKAAKARATFTRALAAYADLVALERSGGSGARQSMENAAEIGNSWVNQRIGEELRRSRWSGEAPWEALDELAADLNLPDLTDLCDIMRLTQEGSQVSTMLRERARAMRIALLKQETAAANRVESRMQVPVTLLVAVFALILVTAPLLAVMS